MAWLYEQKTADLSLLLLHVVYVTKQNKLNNRHFTYPLHAAYLSMLIYTKISLFFIHLTLNLLSMLPRNQKIPFSGLSSTRVINYGVPQSTEVPEYKPFINCMYETH